MDTLLASAAGATGFRGDALLLLSRLPLPITPPPPDCVGTSSVSGGGAGGTYRSVQAGPSGKHNHGTAPQRRLASFHLPSQSRPAAEESPRTCFSGIRMVLVQVHVLGGYVGTHVHVQLGQWAVTGHAPASSTQAHIKAVLPAPYLPYKCT